MWKAYAHGVIDAMPSLLPGQLQLLIREFLRNAGSSAYQRKFCDSCYAHDKAKRIAGFKTRLETLCPEDCPMFCPLHSDLIDLTVEG